MDIEQPSVHLPSYSSSSLSSIRDKIKKNIRQKHLQEILSRTRNAFREYVNSKIDLAKTQMIKQEPSFNPFLRKPKIVGQANIIKPIPPPLLPIQQQNLYLNQPVSNNNFNIAYHPENQNQNFNVNFLNQNLIVNIGQSPLSFLNNLNISANTQGLEYKQKGQVEGMHNSFLNPVEVETKIKRIGQLAKAGDRIDKSNIQQNIQDKKRKDLKAKQAKEQQEKQKKAKQAKLAQDQKRIKYEKRKKEIEKLLTTRKIYTKKDNLVVFDKVLGKGSFSRVYLGADTSKMLLVAVKQVEELVENELSVLANLKSPYLVCLEGYWKRGKNTYLAIQLCQHDLRQQLRFGLTNDMKFKYIIEIVNGLDFLFKNKIIHRDLKCENILVTKDKIAKISDFGLSKQMGHLSNIASIRCGTPSTMAPQILQCDGTYKPMYNNKCDIWSLGIIMHEILYGFHPFDNKKEKVLRMERVYCQKKYGILDKIIDKALVRYERNRIDMLGLKLMLLSKESPIPAKYLSTIEIDEKYSKQMKNQREEEERKIKQKKDKKQISDLFIKPDNIIQQNRREEKREEEKAQWKIQFDIQKKLLREVQMNREVQIFKQQRQLRFILGKNGQMQQKPLQILVQPKKKQFQAEVEKRRDSPPMDFNLKLQNKEIKVLKAKEDPFEKEIQIQQRHITDFLPRPSGEVRRTNYDAKENKKAKVVIPFSEQKRKLCILRPQVVQIENQNLRQKRNNQINSDPILKPILIPVMAIFLAAILVFVSIPIQF